MIKISFCDLNLSNRDSQQCLTYLKSPCPFYLYLYPTTPHEIIGLINNLKLNKANSYEHISPYFLKIAAHVIALTLCVILNLCISFGIFPNKLKVSKVVPVFKSEQSDLIGNCRSISLLSSLSKIFERLLLNRLMSFSYAIKHLFKLSLVFSITIPKSWIH